MINLVLQNFIRNGYVILKPDYPDELHQTIHRKTQLAFKNGNFGNKTLEHVPTLHKILDHVEVRQTLNQIVRDSYIMHLHRHCHINPPNSNGQELHQDGRLANSLVGIILGDVIIIYVWQWLFTILMMYQIRWEEPVLFHPASTITTVIQKMIE